MVQVATGFNKRVGIVGGAGPGGLPLVSVLAERD
jgi:hypothetical protein